MKKKKKRVSRLPGNVVHPAVPTSVGNVPANTNQTLVFIHGDLNGSLTIGSPQQKEPKPIAWVEKLVH